MTLLLAQFVVLAELLGAPSDRVAAAELRAQVELPDMNSATVAAARRSEFERRYSGLVKAMNTFAEKYNQSKGTVWPLKEADAVRKAFRNLERLQPEFETASK